MTKKVVASVSFGCQACGNQNLHSTGAVKTEDEFIYIVYQCLDCKKRLPINIDGIIMELYSIEPPKLTN